MEKVIFRIIKIVMIQNTFLYKTKTIENNK